MKAIWLKQAENVYSESMWKGKLTLSGLNITVAMERMTLACKHTKRRIKREKVTTIIEQRFQEDTNNMLRKNV